MVEYYKRIYYRDFTVVPRKTLSGLIDCAVYKGHRDPEKRVKGKRMRDLFGHTMTDIYRQIDELWYEGESEYQSRMEDFK